MFLKGVTLAGFKSFADRVEFAFGPGVTCIVGPNGCGKSNVVDAFKWVLGEQSARSLRGRQMIDMIFNGSSTRRSGSVAQVDLVFDNADHALAIDAEEVTISRKLYRSGESEYLLNSVPARLKDVRELFMDTGIGTDAYAVIEQGKVDGLLQSSTTERRGIFDEAAGISKYKARKREAARKLDRTAQNLLRVADIIEEVEKRLRSVKQQAGRARSYLQYEERLTELRSAFAMAEYHRLSETTIGLKRDVQAGEDAATALRTQIDQYEAREVGVTTQLDALGETIASTDSALIRVQSELAAQKERIDGAGQRLEEQRVLLERTEERRKGDLTRADGGRQKLAEVEQTATTFEEETRALRDTIDELAEQDRTLARDLSQAQSLLEDEKTGIIDLLRKSAKTNNEIIRLNTHRESLVGEKGRLARRDAEIATELEMQLEQKLQLGLRLREVEGLIEEETRRLEEKKAESERAAVVRQQLRDQLAGAKEQRSALQSRWDVLEDLERKMEGVGVGARRLLDAKRLDDTDDSISCVVGLVADIFDTDVAHARIIEAALGEWDQYLVVGDTSAFLGLMSAMEEAPGRVTAICEDRLPPVISERGFAETPGIVARAVDLVRYAQDHRQLAHRLLGKTIVVEDMEVALALAAQDVSDHRFVTRDGDVVEPDGRVVTGPSTTGAGLITRRTELRDIDVRLAETNDLIGKLTDQLNRCEAEVSHLDTLQQELRTAIYESSTAKVEAGAALQNIDDGITRLTREQPLIANEVAILQEQIGNVLAKSQEGGRSLEVLERENAEREHQVALRTERIDSVVAERVLVQEKLTESKVAAGEVAQKRAAAIDAVHALRRSIADLDASAAAALQDVEQCKARMAEAEATIQDGNSQLGGMEEKRDQLDSEATQLRQERETLRMELESVGEAAKTTRTSLSEAEATIHEHQMRLAETKVRCNELITRVRDEMNVDLAERYDEYEPEEKNWEEVETEIADLRTKMNRLGHVNLDAINELDELEERHTFLATQREDLDAAHRELERLIAKLNEESIRRFKEVFEAVRENFRSMFRKLFGGGRADIILEDPDNMLDCGIEIVAQPPGKDLQSISLMSGGEKSMTAIALLMSIFKSRPSPFAILDEVDAALDEANNERFIRIIQEFVSDVQFIIITHSKWSMNAGDRLYGITMQEPGVSTRVSVQLEGANVA